MKNVNMFVMKNKKTTTRYVRNNQNMMTKWITHCQYVIDIIRCI